MCTNVGVIVKKKKNRDLKNLFTFRAFKLGELLGCKDFAPAALQACLQAADPYKILEVQDGVINGALAYLPVVDGDMMPDMPLVCFSSVFSLFLPKFPLSSAADFLFFFRIF